jgi:hypothetical protein
LNLEELKNKKIALEKMLAQSVKQSMMKGPKFWGPIAQTWAQQLKKVDKEIQDASGKGDAREPDGAGMERKET